VIFFFSFTMGIAMRTVILRPPYDCVRTCTNEMTEFITRSWIYGLRFYVLSYEGEILRETEASLGIGNPWPPIEACLHVYRKDSY